MDLVESAMDSIVDAAMDSSEGHGVESVDRDENISDTVEAEVRTSVGVNDSTSIVVNDSTNRAVSDANGVVWDNNDDITLAAIASTIVNGVVCDVASGNSEVTSSSAVQSRSTSTATVELTNTLADTTGRNTVSSTAGLALSGTSRQAVSRVAGMACSSPITSENRTLAQRSYSTDNQIISALKTDIKDPRFVDYSIESLSEWRSRHGRALFGWLQQCLSQIRSCFRILSIELKKYFFETVPLHLKFTLTMSVSLLLFLSISVITPARLRKHFLRPMKGILQILEMSFSRETKEHSEFAISKLQSFATIVALETEPVDYQEGNVKRKKVELLLDDGKHDRRKNYRRTFGTKDHSRAHHHDEGTESDEETHITNSFNSNSDWSNIYYDWSNIYERASVFTNYDVDVIQFLVGFFVFFNFIYVILSAQDKWWQQDIVKNLESQQSSYFYPLTSTTNVSSTTSSAESDNKVWTLRNSDNSINNRIFDLIETSGIQLMKQQEIVLADLTIQSSIVPESLSLTNSGYSKEGAAGTSSGIDTIITIIDTIASITENFTFVVSSTLLFYSMSRRSIGLWNLWNQMSSISIEYNEYVGDNSPDEHSILLSKIRGQVRNQMGDALKVITIIVLFQYLFSIFSGSDSGTVSIEGSLVCLFLYSLSCGGMALLFRKNRMGFSAITGEVRKHLHTIFSALSTIAYALWHLFFDFETAPSSLAAIGFVFGTINCPWLRKDGTPVTLSAEGAASEVLAKSTAVEDTAVSLSTIGEDTAASTSVKTISETTGENARLKKKEAMLTTTEMKTTAAEEDGPFTTAEKKKGTPTNTGELQIVGLHQTLFGLFLQEIHAPICGRVAYIARTAVIVPLRLFSVVMRMAYDGVIEILFPAVIYIHDTLTGATKATGGSVKAEKSDVKSLEKTVPNGAPTSHLERSKSDPERSNTSKALKRHDGKMKEFLISIFKLKLGMYYLPRLLIWLWMSPIYILRYGVFVALHGLWVGLHGWIEWWVGWIDPISLKPMKLFSKASDNDSRSMSDAITTQINEAGGLENLETDHPTVNYVLEVILGRRDMTRCTVMTNCYGKSKLAMMFLATLQFLLTTLYPLYLPLAFGLCGVFVKRRVVLNFDEPFAVASDPIAMASGNYHDPPVGLNERKDLISEDSVIAIAQIQSRIRYKVDAFKTLSVDKPILELPQETHKSLPSSAGTEPANNLQSWQEVLGVGYSPVHYLFSMVRADKDYFWNILSMFFILPIVFLQALLYDPYFVCILGLQIFILNVPSLARSSVMVVPSYTMSLSANSGRGKLPCYNTTNNAKSQPRIRCHTSDAIEQWRLSGLEEKRIRVCKCCGKMVPGMAGVATGSNLAAHLLNKSKFVNSGFWKVPERRTADSNSIEQNQNENNGNQSTERHPSTQRRNPEESIENSSGEQQSVQQHEQQPSRQERATSTNGTVLGTSTASNQNFSTAEQEASSAGPFFSDTVVTNRITSYNKQMGGIPEHPAAMMCTCVPSASSSESSSRSSSGSCEVPYIEEPYLTRSNVVFNNVRNLRYKPWITKLYRRVYLRKGWKKFFDGMLDKIDERVEWFCGSTPGWLGSRNDSTASRESDFKSFRDSIYGGEYIDEQQMLFWSSVKDKYETSKQCTRATWDEDRVTTGQCSKSTAISLIRRLKNSESRFKAYYLGVWDLSFLYRSSVVYRFYLAYSPTVRREVNLLDEYEEYERTFAPFLHPWKRTLHYAPPGMVSKFSWICRRMKYHCLAEIEPMYSSGRDGGKRGFQSRLIYGLMPNDLLRMRRRRVPAIVKDGEPYFNNTDCNIRTVFKNTKAEREGVISTTVHGENSPSNLGSQSGPNSRSQSPTGSGGGGSSSSSSSGGSWSSGTAIGGRSASIPSRAPSSMQNKNPHIFNEIDTDMYDGYIDYGRRLPPADDASRVVVQGHNLIHGLLLSQQPCSHMKLECTDVEGNKFLSRNWLKIRNTPAVTKSVIEGCGIARQSLKKLKVLPYWIDQEKLLVQGENKSEDLNPAGKKKPLHPVYLDPRYIPILDQVNDRICDQTSYDDQMRDINRCRNPHSNIGSIPFGNWNTNYWRWASPVEDWTGISRENPPSAGSSSSSFSLSTGNANSAGTNSNDRTEVSSNITQSYSRVSPYQTTSPRRARYDQHTLRRGYVSPNMHRNRQAIPNTTLGGTVHASQITPSTLSQSVSGTMGNGITNADPNQNTSVGANASSENTNLSNQNTIAAISASGPSTQVRSGANNTSANHAQWPVPNVISDQLMAAINEFTDDNEYLFHDNANLDAYTDSGNEFQMDRGSSGNPPSTGANGNIPSAQTLNNWLTTIRSEEANGDQDAMEAYRRLVHLRQAQAEANLERVQGRQASRWTRFLGAMERWNNREAGNANLTGESQAANSSEAITAAGADINQSGNPTGGTNNPSGDGQSGSTSSRGSAAGLAFEALRANAAILSRGERVLARAEEARATGTANEEVEGNLAERNFDPNQSMLALGRQINRLDPATLRDMSNLTNQIDPSVTNLPNLMREYAATSSAGRAINSSSPLRANNVSSPVRGGYGPLLLNETQAANFVTEGPQLRGNAALARRLQPPVVDTTSFTERQPTSIDREATGSGTSGREITEPTAVIASTSSTVFDRINADQSASSMTAVPAMSGPTMSGSATRFPRDLLASSIDPVVRELGEDQIAANPANLTSENILDDCSDSQTSINASSNDESDHVIPNVRRSRRGSGVLTTRNEELLPTAPSRNEELAVSLPLISNELRVDDLYSILYTTERPVYSNDSPSNRATTRLGLNAAASADVADTVSDSVARFSAMVSEREGSFAAHSAGNDAAISDIARNDSPDVAADDNDSPNVAAGGGMSVPREGGIEQVTTLELESLVSPPTGSVDPATQMYQSANGSGNGDNVNTNLPNNTPSQDGSNLSLPGPQSSSSSDEGNTIVYRSPVFGPLGIPINGTDQSAIPLRSLLTQERFWMLGNNRANSVPTSGTRPGTGSATNESSRRSSRRESRRISVIPTNIGGSNSMVFPSAVDHLEFGPNSNPPVSVNNSNATVVANNSNPMVFVNMNPNMNSVGDNPTYTHSANFGVPNYNFGNLSEASYTQSESSNSDREDDRSPRGNDHDDQGSSDDDDAALQRDIAGQRGLLFQLNQRGPDLIGDQNNATRDRMRLRGLPRPRGSPGTVNASRSPGQGPRRSPGSGSRQSTGTTASAPTTRRNSTNASGTGAENTRRSPQLVVATGAERIAAAENTISEVSDVLEAMRRANASLRAIVETANAELENSQRNMETADTTTTGNPQFTSQNNEERAAPIGNVADDGQPAGASSPSGDQLVQNSNGAEDINEFRYENADHGHRQIVIRDTSSSQNSSNSDSESNDTTVSEIVEVVNRTGRRFAITHNTNSSIDLANLASLADHGAAIRGGMMNSTGDSPEYEVANDGADGVPPRPAPLFQQERDRARQGAAAAELIGAVEAVRVAREAVEQIEAAMNPGMNVTIELE